MQPGGGGSVLGGGGFGSFSLAPFSLMLARSRLCGSLFDLGTVVLFFFFFVRRHSKVYSI